MLEFEYASAIADLMFDEKSTETLFCLRFEGVKRLMGIAEQYRAALPKADLCDRIFKKKAELIKKAVSKNEVDEILKPSYPYYQYDGQFHKRTRFHIDEEELLFWCCTSPTLAMKHDGKSRALELFKKVYPEVAGRYGI